MRTWVVIALGTSSAVGCTSSLDSAKALCRDFGDPSPACIERRFDTEHAREAEFRKRLTSPDAPGTSQGSGESPLASPPSDSSGQASPPASPPVESGYDRMVRELKETCVSSGGRWTSNLSGQGGGCVK